jgi:hypothetical protein
MNNQTMTRYLIIASIIVLLANGLSACTSLGNGTSPALSTADNPQAEVLFFVEVPDVSVSPGNIILSLLDEVTGLALNPTTFKLQKRDNTHFSVKLPINIGTVLKYRYSRSSALPIMEVSPDNKSIRYRMLVVNAPMTVYDVVSAWEDYPYQGGTGKITGSVLDIITNSPIPNIMVSAGGLNSFTSSDGSFSIIGLPPGTHNLVAYAMDGSYMPFQQGATIESGLTTPAEIRVLPGQAVNITFLLKAPQEYDGLPVRLAGSISQLGNTFGDLSGGVSTIAGRMPILAGLEDGRRYVTISVSAGTYIEYKYTLGDGFWNSELDDQGKFKLRGLVVPEVDTILQDEVSTWESKDKEPIKFEVEVPANTPQSDRVSIQFNPFGWMEPITMWQGSDNHWKFIVYNPLNLTSNFTYRYCRNEQCGMADDSGTPGFENSGRKLPSGVNQVQDTIISWQSLGDNDATMLNDPVVPYDQSYFTGIELSPDYHPSWQPYYSTAISDVMQSGANTILLRPSWACQSPDIPKFDLYPGKNATWQENYEMVWQAKQHGLNVVLYPGIKFDIPLSDWWLTTPHTDTWWRGWFTEYKRFIIHFADLAQQSGVDKLIMGGEWILPSLPGGKLPDGSDSMVPIDSIVFWTDILSTVRAHYSGNLIWEMNYPASINNPPPFLSNFDSFYVTFNGSITSSPTPTVTELQDGFAGIIDTSVYPLIQLYGKPIYIGVEYPSAVGSASGCLASMSTSCGDIDTNIQTELYRAALTVVNYRDWLSGFISQGYYLPARLIDGSSSIHGKPAQDLIDYWFPYILGNTP